MDSKISEANTNLFNELERLGDEQLTLETMQQQLEYSKWVIDEAKETVAESPLVQALQQAELLGIIDI